MPGISSIPSLSSERLKLSLLANVNPTCNTSIAVQVLAVANNKASEENAQCMTSNIILLSTAKVLLYDIAGGTHIVKCLLDFASQSNFIMQGCCAR